jgi:hypothetical protein
METSAIVDELYTGGEEQERINRAAKACLPQKDFESFCSMSRMEGTKRSERILALEGNAVWIFNLTGDFHEARFNVDYRASTLPFSEVLACTVQYEPVRFNPQTRSLELKANFIEIPTRKEDSHLAVWPSDEGWEVDDVERLVEFSEKIASRWATQHH